MPRPISAKLPQFVIDRLLENGYKDLSDYARKNGIIEGTAWSLFRTSKHKTLKNAERLATALGVPLSTIRDILLYSNLERRKGELSKLIEKAGYDNMHKFSKAAGLNGSYMHNLLSGKVNLDSLMTYDKASAGLGLTLEQLAKELLSLAS